MLHIFIVETIDGNFFTITFGGTRSTLGKREANEMDILVNQTLSKSTANESNQFCTNCGNKITPPGSGFCGKCGKQLN